MRNINKLVFLLSICFIVLQARDNPFMLEDNNTSMVSLPSFQKEDVKFNSDARILKNITITYIALDGTEEKISLDINKSIDWHNTYTFTKTKTLTPTPVLDVSVTIPEQSKVKANLEKNSSVNIEVPSDTKEIYDFIAFSSYKNKIKFNTKDDMITHFSIGNPSKIVLDFKRDNILLPTKTFKLNNTSFIHKITFGSHKDYYRIVLYLDGKYKYEIQKDAIGYTLNFL
ncbi:AMIN domain-containing protein [Campylobacter sp. US33a]|uniref:AMIN domain-containing protein n=1 Tax=Campylobacter sp. CCS1377 TaxID=3158229 RepID=A0AAU7E644_9BACT|nr:AMIN domain-containing protein [Campylobacter sp. US33a]MCW1360483.1 AMIN domain-containing protein [Campylobacter jejuni]TEY04026.1 AMIN domain-containing protein [Campylobacter sp. US33a]